MTKEQVLHEQIRKKKDYIYLLEQKLKIAKADIAQAEKLIKKTNTNKPRLLYRGQTQEQK